jgi:hypothetical protein
MPECGGTLRAVPRLFLPQTTLEEWAQDSKADLSGDRLVVSGEKGDYPVTPAVRFVRLVAGADDRNLLERVKTHAQLAELGAEQMEDSVLLGESAYEVVPGYVAEVAVTAVRGEKKQGSPETDLLAAFILNKMS